jgi:hypothetical protein
MVYWLGSRVEKEVTLCLTARVRRCQEGIYKKTLRLRALAVKSVLPKSQ